MTTNFIPRLRIICLAVALSPALQTATFAQNSGCVIPPSGLVGWWKGDGNTLDSAGANNGVAQNISYTNGVVGQAFSCNANVLPYGTYVGVDIPDQPAYALTNSLTIEGWIQPRGDGYNIFWRGDNRPGLDPYFIGMGGNSNFDFYITDANGNTASIGTPLTYSQWWHVAATLDGNSGTMSIYTNGVLAVQTITSIRPFGQLIAGDSPGIGIGNVNDGFNNFPFIGDIDEISLYNRALAPDEIQSIYNAGSAGKCTSTAPTNSCTAPPAGLVSWWPAEGNANDVIGGNNGTLEGGATFAPGKVGLGFRLDGTNSYVQIPDSDALKPTNVTVEAWVWLDPNVTTPRLDYIIFKKNSWDYLFEGYSLLKQSLANDDGTYTDRFSFVVSSGGNQVITYSTTAVQRGVWYHVAGTYDGNRLTLWVNGVAEASAIAGFPLDYGTTPVFIGTSGQPEPYNGKLAGIIDEASIYNRALSTNEIDAIYNAGSAGKCAPAPQTICTPAPSGLVGWWKGDGNTLDSAGANNGVAQNISYTNGVVGQAFACDPENYPYGTYVGVDIPDQPAYALTNSLTIEGWIRPRGDGYVVFFRGDHRPGLDPYVLSMQANNTLLFQITDQAGDSATVPTTLIYNQWYHVAATLDGSTGTMSLYTNGTLAAQTTTTVRPFGQLIPGDSPGIGIGNVNDGGNNFPFIGDIDEISLYNRALAPNEIQSIYNAGSAGKCTSTAPTNSCTASPAGLVSWWPAEGNANDLVGGNNGLLLNGAGFTNGEAGQAFSLNGNSQCVQIPWSPALITSNYSVEAWIDPAAQVSDPINQTLIFGQGFGHCQLVVRPGTTGMIVAFQFGINPYIFPQVVGTTELPIGQFSHVVGTWDGTTLGLYINGVLNAQSVPGFTPADSGCPFFIGGFDAPGSDPCSYVGQFFNGLIDEVSYFNRALSGPEVMGLYNAGSAGKCLPTPAPIIFTQPVDQTVTAGGTATFSLSAQGTPPLSYQWFFGTNLLAGQTAASLVLNNVQPPQAGYYFVVVSNASGTSTSSNALLTVLTYPPTITLQPQNVALFPGSNAVFSVTAGGTARLIYQWYFNDAPLADQTSSSLLLLNVQPNQAGNYSVTVSNAYGFTVSSNALLTVLPPPVCVAPPEGIVAWWRAESNTVDSIGIHDLLVQPSLQLPALNSFYTSGKVGAAFLFAGSYLQALADDELDLGAGGGLTIEAWIRPTSFTAVQPLVEWNDGRGIVGAGLFLNPGTRTGVIGAYFTETNPAVGTVEPRTVLFYSATSVITNLIWQHVALTFDRMTGLASIYVNGAAVAQTNLGVFTPMTKAPVYLGYTPPGLPGGLYPGRPFSGAMDEVSLYNRALTQAEIQSIYLADSAGKCPVGPPPCLSAPDGIVGWWRGQSNALDSVNGNNGVIIDGVGYTNGEVGTGFRFTGGSIRVPASSNLDVGAGAGLTIELWANPVFRQTPLYQGIFPVLDWNTGVSLALSGGLGSSSQILQANLVDSLGTNHVFRSPTQTGAATGWEHVAVTYDKSTGLAVLYLNAHPVTQTNFGIFTPQTTGDVTFAPSLSVIPIGGAAGFQGLLDEISIYNRALTPAEIASIMLARGAGKCAAAPVIITQPRSQVVNVGDTAVLTAQATGTPVLHYQWYFNSNAVDGAASTLLVLTNAQPEQSGNYYVVVTNLFGSTTSSNAVLRINLPPVADASATVSPVIACNPSNATVVLNGSRSFDPDGDSLQYFWYANGGTNAIGTGVVAVVVLPVGTNSITLVASDGWASNQQTASIEVVTIPQDIKRLIDTVEAGVPKSWPLTVTLWEALESVERGNCDSAVDQLQSFQHLVKTQVAPWDAALAQSLIDPARRIIDALNHCDCGCDYNRGHDRDHDHGHMTPRWRGGDGKIHMDFPAPRGPVYIIEASDDLVHWEKIGVATDQNDGTFGFDDPAAVRVSQRFYRVVVP